MRRTMATIALAMLTALALAAPAAAAGPTTTTTTFTVSEQALPCGGGLSFDVEMTARFTERVFDDRITTHALVHGSATGSNGAEVRIHHTWYEVIDLEAGTLTVTGLPFGERVLATDTRRLDRGRLVIDLATGNPLTIAGKFVPGPFDSVLATCELLAQAG